MTDTDLKPIRVKVTQNMIEQYAVISDDYNPIHIDPEYAASTVLGGVIAHGTLSLNLIWRSLEETFGYTAGDVVVSEVRFKSPVRVEDEIEAGGAVQADGSLAVWVRNQAGDHVIEGCVRIQRGTAEAAAS